MVTASTEPTVNDADDPRRWTGRSDVKNEEPSSPIKAGDLRGLFEETLMQLLEEGAAAMVSRTQGSSDVARYRAGDGVESARVGWIHVVRRISSLLVGAAVCRSSQ